MMPAIKPVATVGLQALRAGLPHGLERARKGRPGPHGETEGAVARALAASPDSIRRLFPRCIPCTYPTYPTNGLLLKTYN